MTQETQSPRESDLRRELEFWPGSGVFLFPGQGAQFVGMGKELFENSPGAYQTFKRAENILGTPISELCFNGPKESLDMTPNIQIAIGVVSIAAYRAAVEKIPQLSSIPPVAGAGVSFGELPNLVIANVIDFEDFLRVIYERGHIMDEVGRKNPGRMAIVRRLTREKVEEICARFSQVYPAIYSSRYITVSGSSSQIDEALSCFSRIGGQVIDHIVEYPFHTPLMAQAEERFQEVLKGIKFRDPVYPVILNRNGYAAISGEMIKKFLPGGITRPVDSVAMINVAKLRGGRVFLEFCPKPVISSQIQENEIKTIAIHDFASLDKLELSF